MHPKGHKQLTETEQQNATKKIGMETSAWVGHCTELSYSATRPRSCQGSTGVSDFGIMAA